MKREIPRVQPRRSTQMAAAPTVLAAPRGTVRIEWPGAGVMLTTLAGHATIELAEVHERVAAEAYARGARVHHFFDVYELEGYDTAARVDLTRFAIEHRAHVASAHFLVRSRIVAMGVATASLAARMAGMTFDVTTNRALFLARLKDRTDPPAQRS